MEKKNEVILISVIVLVFISIIIFIISAITNYGIVEFMSKNEGAPDLSQIIFYIVTFGILLVVIFYSAYITRKENGKSTSSLFKSLIMVSIMISLWGIALFHIKVNIGISGFFGFIMLMSIIWLSCLCAVEVSCLKLLIVPYLLFFAIYFNIYTYRISNYDWVERVVDGPGN